jgi:hypothetical protein
MSRQVLLAVAGIVIVVFFSCPEKVTNPDEHTAPAFSYNVGKCIPMPTIRAFADSAFSYSFADTLLVDFWVIANCCPDSDRFDVISTVGTDTLFITIVDTAASLCNCTCPYFIHAEFGNLPKAHYVVRCRFTCLASPYLDRDALYLVEVHKVK